MLHLNGIQWASFNTIPASHAHIVKNYWRVKNVIDLFDNFMGASRYSRANPPFRVAFPGIAPFIIYHRK
jgi:hypothetical protein